MQQLLRIASDQFGLFTRAQAHRCGLTDRMLQRRVRAATVEQVARHVYRVAGTNSSWRQSLLMACLAGGEHCVASHRSAAILHGFDSFRGRPVEVTVPRSVRFKYADAVVHQSLDLEMSDVTAVDGISVTTPTRTLIDLGAVALWPRVEEAFDGAERDQLASTSAVRQRHAEVRRQGRRGVGPMAIVLDHRLDVPPKYVIERRFLRLLEGASLPLPQCQYPVLRPSGQMAFIDAAYPDLRLAIELDGNGAHATRRQRAHDNWRAGEIEDLGWHLRRFTWEQIRDERARVTRVMRSAIAAGSCGV